MQQRLRTWLVGAVLVVVGVLVGYLLPQNAASPRSEVGKVMSVGSGIGSSGAGFDFKSRGASVVHYTLEDPTPWQATPNGRWHLTGQPPCLTPGSKTPVTVTLGVISVHPVGSAP